jgi:hypothetical protein
LKILAFQKQPYAGFLFQAGAGEDWCAMDLAVDPLGGLKDVWQLWNVHRVATE